MNRVVPFRSTLNATMDATAEMVRLATGLGTPALPVPATVSPRDVAVLRHLAAATLPILRTINGQIEAVSYPKSLDKAA